MWRNNPKRTRMTIISRMVSMSHRPTAPTAPQLKFKPGRPKDKNQAYWILERQQWRRIRRRRESDYFGQNGKLGGRGYCIPMSPIRCRLCTSRYIRAISDLHLIKLFVFRVIRAGLWFAKLQAGEKKRSERRAKKKQKEAQEKLKRLVPGVSVPNPVPQQQLSKPRRTFCQKRKVVEKPKEQEHWQSGRRICCAEPAGTWLEIRA